MKMTLKVEGPQGSGKTRLLEAIKESLQGRYSMEVFEGLHTADVMETNQVRVHKCLVKGCENHSHQGQFIGNLCMPCHQAITTGVAGHGNGFIGELYRDNKALAAEKVSKQENLKRAVRTAVEYIRWRPMTPTRTATLAEIEDLLNPKPEMETTTVERWTFGDGCDTFATEEEARDNATHSGEVYKLTGTYQRPKPQPVEKSVSGTVRGGRGLISIDVSLEHQGDPPPMGSAVTLTWQEIPK